MSYGMQVSPMNLIRLLAIQSILWDTSKSHKSHGTTSYTERPTGHKQTIAVAC